MLNFFVSAILTALTSLLLAFFVYSINPNSRLYRLFTFYTLSISIWSFPYAFMAYVQNERSAIILGHAFHFGITFIAIFFVHFTLVLLNTSDNKIKAIMKPLYAIAFVFTLLIPTRWFISNVTPKFGFKYFSNAGPAYYPYLLFWLSCIIYGLYKLYKGYILSTGLKRNQLKYLFFASLIGYVAGSENFLLVFNIEYPFYPFVTYGIPIYVVIITYAIVRHQLLDINIVIRRTIIYSSLITILTVTYLLVVLVAERFSSHFFGYTTLPMTIVTASIIAIAFIPIKNKIQYIVDRLFFKGTLDSLAKEKALMHQELMRSERLKAVATLAAGMAHEIKNPLTAIKTFTEHLKEKKDDSEFIAKFERIVGGEVDKINNLVHSLLDFAKPNPLKFETSNINYLLEDTLSLLNNEIIKHKITLVKKYSELPLIQADPNQLKQAFLNLMLNAIEAMPTGGKLTLDISINKTYQIEVSISDTGRGIPKKELPHIFDPFFSTKETGTGLGLSITHEIIKKHNGTITVESELGEGTAVKIILWSEVEN